MTEIHSYNHYVILRKMLIFKFEYFDIWGGQKVLNGRVMQHSSYEDKKKKVLNYYHSKKKRFKKLLKYYIYIYFNFANKSTHVVQLELN